MLNFSETIQGEQCKENGWGVEMNIFQTLDNINIKTFV